MEALDAFEKWVLFLKTNDDAEMEELKMDDDMILAITEIEIAKMTPLERQHYRARIDGIRDYDSGMIGSYDAGVEKGMQEGSKIAKLQIFTKQITKRFPKIATESLNKIAALNDTQIDNLLQMIFDFQSQQEFESTLFAFADDSVRNM